MMAQVDAEVEAKKKTVEIIGQKKKKEGPGAIIGRDGEKIPLDENKFSSIFDKLGHDTIHAIRTLKALGGLDVNALQTKPPEPKKCCCWGTPIGDKLLELAEDLDRDGNTLLAQVHANGTSLVS